MRGTTLVPHVPAASTLQLLAPLSANPWFGALPLRERRAMLAASELQRVPPGAMLFRQGDRVPAGTGAFYCLVKGSIKASSLREDGKEAILAVLEAGNWFGEISLIDGQPRTHDATAIVASEVLALPRAAFDALMHKPVFSHAVCAMLAARVRALYGMVEDATLRSTRARVARRLLLLARGDATQASDTRPVVPVSQEQLAMMLGVTRQTLSKELHLLVDAGAVVLGYGRIELASVALLEKLGVDG
jgi:CRP/FNR family cyclic AMP-dependent transcriptional regulator